MSRWSSCAALAAAVLLTFAASPATAQINPFRGYRGPVLTSADIQAGTEAADRLLAQKPAKVGASQFWVGAISGNTGTVTIERIFQQNDRECRALRAKIQYKAGSARDWLLNVCQVSGAWKIAS